MEELIYSFFLRSFFHSVYGDKIDIKHCINLKYTV